MLLACDPKVHRELARYPAITGKPGIIQHFHAAGSGPQWRRSRLLGIFLYCRITKSRDIVPPFSRQEAADC